MYLNRFNIYLHDVALLRAPLPAAIVDKGGPEVRWANYCRSVLAPMCFYRFDALKDGLYFFVGEQKSLPGREARSDIDAIGRPLAIAWFEKCDDTIDGVLVRRADRDPSHMV